MLAAVPLLWPAIPPLGDLPGHMGRWHIALAIAHSPALRHYYQFRWGLIGNLGVDLAVVPFAALIGLEPATKLVVMLIPPITVTGMLWAAREAHGRIPATALIALPLAYAWPFQLGFVNYELAQALALCAFALWLRLGRRQRLRIRALAMAPIACLLWLAHDFGWGLFGLLAFGGEVARLREAGHRWPGAIGGAVFQCLPLALPLVAMALTHGDNAGGRIAGDWFDLPTKAGWLIAILRDRWPAYDALALLPLVMLLYLAARDRRLGFTPTLGCPALLCLVAFIVLPRLLMGGAYVDMRMAPMMLALALLAIRTPDDPRFAGRLALAGLAFLAVRTATTTVSFAIRSNVWQRELAALDAMPPGASVLTLVNMPCASPGADDRLDHLAGLAIVRRDVFVNEQWALTGQQLLAIRHVSAAPYLGDPSQLVYPPSCKGPGSNFARAIGGFNRRAFGYVWTIGFPPGSARAPDLVPAWSDGHSALYRVISR